MASRPRWKERLIDVDDESSSSPASCSWILNSIDHLRICRHVQTHHTTALRSAYFLSHTHLSVYAAYLTEHLRIIKRVKLAFFILCICAGVLTWRQTKQSKTPSVFHFRFPPSLSLLCVGVEWRPPVYFDIPNSPMKLRVRLYGKKWGMCHGMFLWATPDPSNWPDVNPSTLSKRLGTECPCLRCEETVIVEQQVFKSIPVRQSPVVSSELWCGLGRCQGAFGVLWSSWITPILCMLLDSLLLPTRLQGTIYLHFLLCRTKCQLKDKKESCACVHVWKNTHKKKRN